MASILPTEMETSSFELFEESSLLDPNASFFTPLPDHVTERRRKRTTVFESMLENVSEEERCWSQRQDETEEINLPSIPQNERASKIRRSSAPVVPQRSAQVAPDILTRLSSPLVQTLKRTVTPYRWNFSKTQNVVVNNDSKLVMRHDSAYERYIQADNEPWLSYMTSMLRRVFTFRATWTPTWYDRMKFAMSKLIMYSVQLLIVTFVLVGLYLSVWEHSDKLDGKNSLEKVTSIAPIYPTQETSYSYDLILTLDQQEEQIRAFNSCCIRNVECLQQNEVYKEELNNLRRHCSHKLAVKENVIINANPSGPWEEKLNENKEANEDVFS